MDDRSRAVCLSSGELLESNTLARGLAILAVVACHIPYAHEFWKPLWLFASAGKLAVSVFLFSSGLLLQAGVNRAGGRLDPGSWLKRRFWRIYPVYWISLAVTLLFAWLLRGRLYGPAALLANAAGIPMWLRLPVVSGGYTAPFWFISLLLLCYALFLATWRIRRKELLAAGALVLSCWALRAGGFMEAAVVAFPSFFAGMLLADRLASRGEAAFDARLHLALFLPLLAFLGFVFKGRSFFQWGEGMSGWLDMAGCAGLTIIPWPALVLVAWLQKTLKRAAPAGLRVLLRVSGMAFALYCIHEPLLAVLEKASAAGHPWAGLLAYAAAVLLAAVALDAVDRKLRGGAA